MQQLKKTFGSLKEPREVPETAKEMDAMPKWAVGGFFQMPMVKTLAASSAQKRKKTSSHQHSRLQIRSTFKPIFLDLPRSTGAR